jgi:hypothetical protein
MSVLEEKFIQRTEMDLPTNRETRDTVSSREFARSDIINSYRVAEFVTLTRGGSPVCWPLFPGFENARITFSTGYVYSGKARNAQRNARVAALFSDPTASGRPEDDPCVLVQGLAEVFDQDLQRNTERYVDQLLKRGGTLFRLMLRIPRLRQLLVGYVARIWIEVVPHRENVWPREDPLPQPLRNASRPTAFTPKPGILLPQEVFGWLSRYTRPQSCLTLIRQAGLQRYV